MPNIEASLIEKKEYSAGKPETVAELITKQDELEKLAKKLEGETCLAVDTESNSLHAYQERVCLIQFSTQQTDYLVDPIMLQDLSPLQPLFADPGIEKVFHAAEYDVLCMKRDYGFEFAGVFDTMIAARILGREEIGLAAMLEQAFNVQLDKHGQRADWGKRPIPAELLDYARLDTHYLIPLRDRLWEELEEKGLLELANEDFRRVCAVQANENGRGNGESRTVDPFRIRGAHDLSPRQAAVLQELCRYRDKAAREMDRPLFKVINDHVLINIAIRKPHSLEELRKIPGMSPTQTRRHGRQLLEAVQAGLKAPLLYPKQPKRLDRAVLHRLEALRDWRKKTAGKMGVPSDVVLPRDLMMTLVQEQPHNLHELREIMLFYPWRYEHFREPILKAMENC